MNTRHPFELFMPALCTLSGLSLLIGGASPQSIDSALGPVARGVWAVMLTVGGSLTLIGVLRRRHWSGLLVEQLGLVSLGGATLVYAAAVVAYVGWAGGLPASITVGFGTACFVRVWQIQRIVQRVSK